MGIHFEFGLIAMKSYLPRMHFSIALQTCQLSSYCLEILRGYAFVTMDDPEDALMCVKNISGRQHLQMMITMMSIAVALALLPSNHSMSCCLYVFDNTNNVINTLLGQDVDGRLIKVEVATGIRGRRDRGDRDRDRGDRHAGGRDRDFNRDHWYRHDNLISCKPLVAKTFYLCIFCVLPTLSGNSIRILNF